MVSLWKIFWVFAKVGAFTVGGGYAMILIIEQEVTKRGWISKEEFPDILALSQSAPGVLAVNMSIFAGYRMRGLKGSIIATLGSITAPFLIILAIAMLAVGYQDNPTIIRIFKGVRPVVVSLIAVPTIELAKRSNKKLWSWTLTVLAIVLVGFMEISAVHVLLTTIIAAITYTLYKDKILTRPKAQNKLQEQKSLKIENQGLEVNNNETTTKGLRENQDLKENKSAKSTKSPKSNSSAKFKKSQNLNINKREEEK